MDNNLKSRYKNIMNQVTMTSDEYSDTVMMCKQLMQISNASFENLGNKMGLSRASIDRILNSDISDGVTFTNAKRIRELYTILLEMAEETLNPNYEGLQTQLEKKRITFDNIIDVGPVIVDGFSKVISNVMEGTKVVHGSNKNTDSERIICLLGELELPSVIIGGLVPQFFEYYCEWNKNKYIYTVAYDNSKDEFLLFEMIIPDYTKDKDFKEFCISANIINFNYISELLAAVRKIITEDNSLTYRYMLEELKDYFGEKFSSKI